VAYPKRVAPRPTPGPVAPGGAGGHRAGGGTRRTTVLRRAFPGRATELAHGGAAPHTGGAPAVTAITAAPLAEPRPDAPDRGPADTAPRPPGTRTDRARLARTVERSARPVVAPEVDR
jgi:hypothetical protein